VELARQIKEKTDEYRALKASRKTRRDFKRQINPLISKYNKEIGSNILKLL
jgi:hypothetical protein